VWGPDGCITRPQAWRDGQRRGLRRADLSDCGPAGHGVALHVASADLKLGMAAARVSLEMEAEKHSGTIAGSVREAIQFTVLGLSGEDGRKP